mgnify:FL=1
MLNNPCNKFDPDGQAPCCDYVFQANGTYQEIKTPPSQASRFYLENTSNNLVNYAIMNVAAMVYVEMTQGSLEEKQVVAEVVRNRVVVSNEFARENNGKMEYGATTFSVLNAKGSTGQAHFEALDKGATNQKFKDAKAGIFANSREKAAFLESMTASLAAFNQKTNISGGAIQYNSPRRSQNDLSKNELFKVVYPKNYDSLSRLNMNIMAVIYNPNDYKGARYNTYLNNFFMNPNLKVTITKGEYKDVSNK